jgi:hypothetical protein
MGWLSAPDQEEPRRLIGHCIADLLFTFAHHRHHPGDDVLQAASAALLIGLKDMEQQVRFALLPQYRPSELIKLIQNHALGCLWLCGPPHHAAWGRRSTP